MYQGKGKNKALKTVNEDGTLHNFFILRHLIILNLNRLTRFLSFLYSNYVMDELDMATIEIEVNDALLTLIVDQVRPDEQRSKLTKFLNGCHHPGGSLIY